MKSLTIAPLLLAPLLVAPAHAEAAAELCFGQVPTIVGTANQAVVGTDGPDVILAENSRSVRGLGGNDDICIVGQLNRKLDAGPGDDRVETGRAVYGVDVNLGSGSDTFVGGDGFDEVNAGDTFDAAASLPLGIDHITTGGGRDRVSTGVDQDSTAANPDVIATGAGGDQIRVRGSYIPSIDAGRSADQVYVYSTAGGVWSVDAGTGAVSRDGVEMGPVTHVTTYELEKLNWSELTFLGGPKSDELWLAGRSGRVGEDGPVAVDMGPGPDYAWVRSQDVGSVAGGPDNDTLFVEGAKTTTPATKLYANLEAETYKLTGGPQTYIPGWERHTFNEVNRSTVDGAAGKDRLTVWGCGNTIRGRGGNDNLTAFNCDEGPELGDRIEGGPGNDRMSGTNYRDRIIGGPGRDYAMGGGGHDVCAVEVKDYCH